MRYGLNLVLKIIGTLLTTCTAVVLTIAMINVAIVLIPYIILLFIGGYAESVNQTVTAKLTKRLK